MPVDSPDGPAPEQLSSNVMNYLVWRYLQEAGYDRAAAQLERNWVGKGNNPENLPFAANVKKGALVNLAQDGLYFDHLQAAVKDPDTPQIMRRYRFGPDHGPKFSIPDEPRERRRVRDVSRISSAGGRDVQNGTAADTPPQRGPKRKRKSAGAERRLNGDMMMDIDAPVGPTSVLDPAVPEAESPLAVIEEAPIVDTLSIGQSKESFTEQPRDLLPDTSFVAFENKPTLEHVKWSPHHPQALFTAGKNHMRTYQIKTPVPESGLETVSQAGQVHSEAFDIEAFCWTERKQGVFSTRETFENEHGNTMTRSKLFSFTDFSRKASLLDPMAGTIVALQYNSDSKLLLCLSYGEVAVIRIWKLTDSGWEYKTMKTIRAELYDAAWTADTTFIVCGISTLELYDVTDEITVVKSVETPHDWFRLKFDKVCDIVACLDERMHALGIMKLGGDLKVEVEPFKDAQISEFAFQPIKNKASRTESTPRLLATATTNGKVQVWNSLVPFTLVHEFNMGKQATAQTLAFSPDGFYLAAAGYDSLVIWKSEEGGEPKAIWKIGEAHERWKCVPGDAEEDWLHALSWDADGKKIAFGLNSQVAIIRMSPLVTGPALP